MLAYKMNHEWELLVGRESSNRDTWKIRWILTRQTEVKLSGEVVIDMKSVAHEAPVWHSLVGVMRIFREDCYWISGRPFTSETCLQTNLRHSPETWDWLGGMRPQQWDEAIGEICSPGQARFIRNNCIIVSDLEKVGEEGSWQDESQLTISSTDSLFDQEESETQSTP